MISSITQFIGEASQNVKIAVSTSLATATTGTITWLEWVPSDIGKIATILGAALSMILIYNHFKKNQREKELHDIEMAKKKLELKLLECSTK